MLAPDRPLAREAAHADLARFAAACYYEPDAAFAEERLFEHLVEAAALVDGELAGAARRLGAAFAAAELQALLVDYTRLFLGPSGALAQPYASVWLAGKSELMLPETLDVMQLYAEAGFAVDEDFHELPDHIAVELEFLYQLAYRENAARVAGEAAEAGRVQARRRRFVEAHLARWAGPFAQAIRDGAETPFYAALADLTERLVQLEAQRSQA